MAKKKNTTFSSQNKTHSGRRLPKKKSEETEITYDNIREDNEFMLEVEKERKNLAKERDKARQGDKTDVSFWINLVFQCEAQAKEFAAYLNELGVASAFDTYYDGQQYAEKIGLPVTDFKLQPHKSSLNKRLVDLVDREVIEEYEVSNLKR